VVVGASNSLSSSFACASPELENAAGLAVTAAPGPEVHAVAASSVATRPRMTAQHALRRGDH
jgi:hypothetical protein